MKQFILFTSFFCLIHVKVHSQFVEIPDANFRIALVAIYPNCFNNKMQMDTSCGVIVSDTILNLKSKSINNLNGIQYFDNLKRLNCNNNQLTSLPALPITLTHLYCSNNLLTSLPILPNTLILLDCYGNQLISLPVLPNKLKELGCGSNKLTNLPTLPHSLIRFTCHDNYSITSILFFPNSITLIQCDNNKLTNLPALPDSLTSFSCASNRLTSLPNLPQKLTSLVCSQNLLTFLPSLPNTLTYLQCPENKLTCLPFLPTNISYLHIHGNEINCLPNKPPEIAQNIDWEMAPICDNFNNPNKCQVYAPLEVEQNPISTKVWLHPNPSKGQITFSEDGEVELYDPNGILILTAKTNLKTMYITSLQNGIYFVRHTNTLGLTKSIKLVKE